MHRAAAVPQHQEQKHAAWSGQSHFHLPEIFTEPKINTFYYSLSSVNDLIHPDVVFTLKPNEGDLLTAVSLRSSQPTCCTTSVRQQ